MDSGSLHISSGSGLASNQESSSLLDHEKVEQSLRFLLDCDTGIFKNEETLIHLNTIEAVADNGGWAVEHLDLLIQQLTSVPSPAQISRRIVYSLVPSINIPAHLLVRLALWGLGSSKLSRDCVVLPVLKLISLSLQYDCVTNKQELLCLYELFLSYLSKEKLTNTVADILQLITTKSEVTEWRVRSVMRCQHKTGSSYALDRLLWAYRQMRPDLLPACAAPAAKATSVNTVIGKRFHKVWEERLEQNLEADNRNGIWIGGYEIGNVFKKSKRDSLIPSKDILNVLRGIKAKRDRRVDLGELRTVEKVVGSAHDVQLPANILSLLRCKAIVQILAIDPGLVERLSMTLFHTLKNEFICCDGAVGIRDETRRRRRRNKILSCIVKLQECVQQGLPVVGRFLVEYLDSWNGETHFLSILRLISQLQITDYKELHDCVIAPLMRHFVKFNMVKQLILLGYMHTLLRTWAAIEFKRFTNYTRSIFPISSANCENALESIIHLSTEIGEMTMLALSITQERGESTLMLTSQVLLMYRITQRIMLEFSIPVRLELPASYMYSALFSHSAGLLAQACQHVLLNKKKVFPFLKKALRSLEITDGYDTTDSSLIADLVSVESREQLLVTTRDMLVFLSPGNVNITSDSILRQGWSAPLGEEWMRESLYLSSHPALLSFVVEYIDSLSLSEEEKQLAWVQLSEEVDEHHEWETDITLVQDKPRISSRSFYNIKAPLKVRPKRSTDRLGNITTFLHFVASYLPCIQEFVMEFKQKASEPRRLENIRKDNDCRSMISLETVDSGVGSLHQGRGKNVLSPANALQVIPRTSSKQIMKEKEWVSALNLKSHGTVTSSLMQNLSEVATKSNLAKDDIATTNEASGSYDRSDENLKSEIRKNIKLRSRKISDGSPLPKKRKPAVKKNDKNVLRDKN